MSVGASASSDLCNRLPLLPSGIFFHYHIISHKICIHFLHSASLNASAVQESFSVPYYVTLPVVLRRCFICCVL